MPYEEKGKWVYVMAVVATYVAYVAVIVSRADGGPLAGVAYVAPMLWAIGISIVLTIVGSIVVGVVRPSDSTKADARDKEIDRRGEYVGGMVLGVLTVAPLGLAMVEADYFWIANAIYAACVLANVVSSAVKLVAYRRGL